MFVIGYVLFVYLFIFVLICVEIIYILCFYYWEENEKIVLFYVKIYRLFICFFCILGNKWIGIVRNFLLNVDLEDIKDIEKLEVVFLIWKILVCCLDWICFLSNLFIVVLVVIVFFVIVNVMF